MQESSTKHVNDTGGHPASCLREQTNIRRCWLKFNMHLSSHDLSVFSTTASSSTSPSLTNSSWHGCGLGKLGVPRKPLNRRRFSDPRVNPVFSCQKILTPRFWYQDAETWNQEGVRQIAISSLWHIPKCQPLSKWKNIGIIQEAWALKTVTCQTHTHTKSAMFSRKSLGFLLKTCWSTFAKQNSTQNFWHTDWRMNVANCGPS